ncbi:ferric reductase-like transmembrane domain-containing protein [Stappia sp. ES.058]|uniref:ferric reductase-like transmembrane domain-containing protein n=1 Tax=Stappia sp. ES.058 TaxID=1881061 RepID=UPI00087B7FDB|nr:ferric reductase-like transmembrane domain-containing protein [Stappia sp. ES.058]SDU19281.1 Ferric reductase like transmembrane component [Stappia sp. ES.058]
MVRARAALVWAALAVAIAVPLAIAATSPLLAWRQPVYIVAGLAGVVALALMLVQPLLAGGALPGLPSPKGRRVHRWVGALLIAAVLAHVIGLWLTSPPDVIDALLFASPTPFSAWGVIAMWALFAAGLLAALRHRLRIRPRVFRLAHTGLVAVVIAGSVVHALLIEGTMGDISKAVLCALAALAFVKTVADLRTWRLLVRRRS